MNSSSNACPCEAPGFAYCLLERGVHKHMTQHTLSTSAEPQSLLRRFNARWGL